MRYAGIMSFFVQSHKVTKLTERSFAVSSLVRSWSAGSLQLNEQTDQLLTRDETAKLLSVSLVTLWDWTKKDIIPAYRIGNKVRYKKGEVLNALQQMNKFNH